MRKYLSLLLLFTFSNQAFGAVGIASFVTDLVTTGASLTTTAFNVPDKPDRAIVVVTGTTDLTNGPIASVSGAGATWQTVASLAFNNAERCEVWYGLNPSPGSQTVTITFTATLGATVDFTAGTYSLYNVDQSSPIQQNSGVLTASNGAAGFSNGLSISMMADNGARTMSGCTTVLDGSVANQGVYEWAHCSDRPRSVFAWSAVVAASNIAFVVKGARPRSGQGGM